jgi:hypothetical protein
MGLQVLKELKEFKGRLEIKALKELKEILVQQDNLEQQAQQVLHLLVVILLVQCMVILVVKFVTQAIVINNQLQYMLLLQTLEIFAVFH